MGACQSSLVNASGDRRSTSLLKDYAALAGRDVRLTLNLKV